MRIQRWVWLLTGIIGLCVCRADVTRSLVVATFNLENYLLEPVGGRSAKTAASRDQVARTIAAIQPQVLAVQEIGSGRAIMDLQQRLSSVGWDLPHAELVGGWDTNLWVAVLSRYPFRARRSHTNDSYLLSGRRWHTLRGIAEVEIEPRPGQRYVVLATHLKSKRVSAQADEAEVREAEARGLRGHVDAVFRRDPKASVIVCGDFNDHPDSRPLRLLLGKGRHALVDTRPAERSTNSRSSLTANHRSRSIVWTHYFAEQDTYSRFDYILLSRSLVDRWDRHGSYVYADPDWGVASDHRPVVCEISLSE